MATITRLEFVLAPGPTIDALLVRIAATVAFTDFDRDTGLEYVLAFHLVGTGPLVIDGLPSPPGGRPAGPGAEHEVATELQSFPPVRIRDPRSVLIDVDPSDDDVIALAPDADGTRVLDFEFEIARTTADEDPDEHDPDELQVRAQLVPDLPVPTTAASNVVRETL